MNIICKFCSAKRFKNESSNICCHNGKVQILKLEEPPQPLKSHLESDEFTSKAVPYNFQIKNFQSKKIISGRFNSVFKIQGQMYHLISNSLLPNNITLEKFIQIFFYRIDKQIDKKSNIFDNLSRQVINDIQNLSISINIIVNSFLTNFKKMITNNF